VLGRFLVVLILWISITPAPDLIAQEIISGKIVEEKSGEPLPFATVVIQGTLSGTTSNADGYFTILETPRQGMKLEISYVGYETGIFEIDLKSSDNLVVRLNPLISTLEEVVISADTYKFLNVSSGVSTATISTKQLALLPTIGETDIFRSLQLLPGVVGTNENSSGLYVRGGTPDQNLVLLDGMTVYNVSHFYGFFSAFNTNAIKDVQLFKGAYPARYGGRLSSVVDLTGRTGSFEDFKGGVNVNLLSAGGYLEVPLFKKVSFLFAGRRSYTDILQSSVYNKITDNLVREDEFANLDEEFSIATLEPTFYFYDWNSKLSYKPTERDLITISVYSGKDYLDESREIERTFAEDIYINANVDEKTDWGNKGVSGKWSRQWSPRIYTSVLMAGSRYFSNYYRNGFLQVSIPEEDSIILTGSRQTFEDNTVTDQTIKADVEWLLSNKHKLDFGGSITRTNIDYIHTRDDTVTILSRDQQADYSSFYISDSWSPDPRIKVMAGFRLSDYEFSDPLLFEPRLSATYEIIKSIKLKAAIGRHYQFVNRIINENLSEGSRDFWLLADGDQVEVSSATHYIGGVSYELDQWLFDVEGYYKKLDGLSEFSLRFRRGIEINADELFFTGNGVARGIEFLVQKKHGIYTGWVSYTLSEVLHTFEAFNEGNAFPALQDQRHEIKWVNSAELEDWTFSATLIYGSGKPYSEPEGRYSIELLDGRKFNYIGVGVKNGSRLPAYSRVDISVHYKFSIGNAKGDIGVSVFNFLNNENIWYYEYDFNQDPFLTTEVNYLGMTPNISIGVDF